MSRMLRSQMLKRNASLRASRVGWAKVLALEMPGRREKMVKTLSGVSCGLESKETGLGSVFE
eukprot:2693727-Rhodomonas_salina.1